MPSCWADQIAPYDQKTAWELRGQAEKIVRDYKESQRLPGGAVIGHGEDDDKADNYGGPAATVGNFVANRQKISHISQLDGGNYSMLNCTMASAAMMGHTLGTEGLVGSDLRAKTGDIEGGTTLLQAKYALQESGVDPSLLRYKDNYSFDKFKINIKQGSTSMVSGYLGNMGGSGLNNAGASYNHNIYVVKYHPKKGFFVLDPAKSNDKGTWLSESQMRAFAWTGNIGSYSRNGSVMMSPKGTLMTRWNKGKTYDPRNNRSYSSRVTATQAQRERSKAGAAFGGELYGEEGLVSFISVDTPATTPAGEQYEGQFAAGVTAADVTAAAQAVEDSYNTPEHKARLASAGIKYGDKSLDTKDEVTDEITNRTQATSSMKQWIDGFAASYQGGDGAVRVVVGSEVRYLTLEEVGQLERELVVALDGLAILNQAIANPEGYALARDTISDVILASQTLTETDETWEQNRLMANGMDRMMNADSPEEAKAVAEDVLADLEQFTENYGQQQAGYDPTTGSVTLPEGEQEVNTEQDVMVNALGDNPDAAQNEAFKAVLEVIADPEAHPVQVEQALIQFAEQFEDVTLPPGWPVPTDEPIEPGEGTFLAQLVNQRNTNWNLDNGEGEMVMLDGELHYVPYESVMGEYAEGGRAEGVEVQEGVETPDGTLDVAYGTGAAQALDLDYIRDTLGIELPPEFTVTAEGLPVAFIMQNGEVTPIRVIPSQDAIGPKMLKVNNIEAVTAFFDKKGIAHSLEEDGYVDGDTLALLSENDLRQLVHGGDEAALVGEDYLVYTMQLPGQASKWFQDPETGLWAYDGLPNIGKGEKALPGSEPDAIPGYIGSERNETGRPIPDQKGYVSDSPATDFTPTPLGVGVVPEHAQILQSAGEGNTDSGMRHDPVDGEVVQATEEQVENSIAGLSRARDVLENAVQKVTEAAQATWEAMKREDEVANDPFQSGELGLEALNNPYGMPDLSAVGATDTQSERRSIWEPPKAVSDLMDTDWSSKFEEWGNNLQTGMRDARIPKVEWKPSEQPGMIKSEMGYVEVDAPSSAEDYTPPPAPKPKQTTGQPAKPRML
jgi:hypothetical protein